jgi:hypothetical protein
MSLSSLRNDLRNFLDLLIAKEIALLATPPIEARDRGRLRLSWPGFASGQLFRNKSSTIEEYCEWIRAGAYSAILFDGAILQISFDLDGTKVVGHRLSYFPCPFDIDSTRLREEPLLDVLEDFRHTPDAIRLRSPIRFDFDPAHRTLGHPQTHMTALWDHCRWAVATPLSLGHFVRFVFRHFYPSLWAQYPFLRNWSQTRVAKGEITEAEASLLHISWREPLSAAGNDGPRGRRT